MMTAEVLKLDVRDPERRHACMRAERGAAAHDTLCATGIACSCPALAQPNPSWMPASPAGCPPHGDASMHPPQQQVITCLLLFPACTPTSVAPLHPRPPSPRTSVVWADTAYGDTTYTLSR